MAETIWLTKRQPLRLLHTEKDTAMKWPRGKFNGQRITGVTVRMEIDVLDWWWRLSCEFGTLRIFVGPVCFWIDANYEPIDADAEQIPF